MRILYVDIDCLRPDHLGCYGYSRPTSPTIDAVAAEGARFEHYYCASSPCVPSRTAWVSGRFGVRNGVVSNHTAGAQFRIRNRAYGGPAAENEMLPRQLRRHGWDTISISNFPDRHQSLWFMIGWSEFHTPNLKSGAETAEEVNEAVLPWLRQNARRDNFLLHINYWDVHRCYKMDASWADPLEGQPVPQSWPDEAAIAQHQEIKGPFTANGQFGPDGSPWALMPDAIRSRADFEQMIDGYDAAIRYVDHHLAELLAELDRQGVLEDTAIIISGDHGDAFGEHGIYSDHVCADECIHRVPLIIRWPGVAKAGHVDRSFLYNVDFAPTLCELLGMPAAAEWDGESFAANVRGEPGLDREYLVWDTALYTIQRAVRTHRHLMIRTYDDYGYGMAPVELYDMVADPYQTTNIAADEPETVGRCSALMDDWLQAQTKKPDWQGDPLSVVIAERAASKG